MLIKNLNENKQKIAADQDVKKRVSEMNNSFILAAEKLDEAIKNPNINDQQRQQIEKRN